VSINRTAVRATPIDWAAEFQRNQGWLRKILSCRIRDPAAVDDCLQEIAVAIVRQDNKPHDPEKIPAWLYQVAVRKAITFHRSNGRKSRLMDELARQFEARGDLSTGCSQLENLVRNESRQQLRQALQRLDPTDRELLLLKYTEHWTYQQLAERLGSSLASVEYRLVQAKKRLRLLLANQRDE